MKKFFAFMFSVLLVAFLSTSFTHIEKTVDNDVGYSLTIDQNTTVIPTISVPVVSGESFILIDRGVSVPYLGLITSESMIYNNNFRFTGIYDLQMYDRYSWQELHTTWQRFTKPIQSSRQNQLRGVNTRLTDYKLLPKT